MWVQGITITNKHKLLVFLKELSKIKFDEVTIIVKGGNKEYEEFKQIFDRASRQKGGNHNRRHGNSYKTFA